MFFSFSFLSSNQTFFLHYHCFLDQTAKIRRWKHLSRSLQCFFTRAGCLPTCYLGTWFPGYLLYKTKAPLQVPARTYSRTVSEICSPEPQGYCQFRWSNCIAWPTVRVWPGISQAIPTAYQGTCGRRTCSLFSSFERAAPLLFQGKRICSQWDVTWGLRSRRKQLIA